MKARKQENMKALKHESKKARKQIVLMF